MSRFREGEYEPTIDKNGREINTTGLYYGRVRAALRSKRGRAALVELREALMALPEKLLIEGALCTVGLDERISAMPVMETIEVEPPIRGEDGEILRDEKGSIRRGPAEATAVPNWKRTALIEFVGEHEGEPEGVCAVGAYVWWQRVKAGMDPAAAFDDLPVLPDTDGGEWETAQAGQAAGLTETLAYELAYMNDERLGGASPEDRWRKVVDWIDGELAKPSLAKAAR